MDKMHTLIRGKIFQSPVAFFICLIGIAILSASVHPLDSDEGMILNGAWNLFRDRDLYAQSFEFVGPGSYYLVAWVWQLLGAATYEGAKAAGLLAAAGASLAVLQTGKELAGRRISVVPALIFFVAVLSGPIVNHNTIFLLPASWSLFFAVRGMLRNNGRDIVFSGLLTGFAVLVLQHKGVALAASLVLAILITGLLRKEAGIPLRRLLPFAFSALLPVLLLLAWDAEAIFEQLVLFPLNHYMGVQNVQQSHYFIWLGAVVIWLLVLWRIISTQPSLALLPLGIVQSVLLVTVIQRPDPYHFSTVLFPFAAVFPLFAQTHIFPSPPATSFVILVRNLMGVGLSVSLVAFSVSGYLIMLRNAISSSAARVEITREISRYCPDGLLYAGPFIPGLYFETGKLNATRYSILLERFNTESQFIQARLDLERNKPECIVIDNWVGIRFGHTGHNPVENWVARNYIVAHQIGTAKILRLASGLGNPTAPSLASMTK